MLLPLLSSIQSRIEKARCIANLKNLYVGAELYTQQYSHWPQVDPRLINSVPTAYASEWIEILKPMGVDPATWICPTTQRLLGSPDQANPKNVRIDYLATPFDRRAMTPHRWSGQPWFIEKGAFHGNGNLIIFTDGSVQELNDFVQRGGATKR